MTILVSFLVALVIGFVVFIICQAIPFTARYAEAIGLIVAVLVFLARVN